MVVSSGAEAGVAAGEDLPTGAEPYGEFAKVLGGVAGAVCIAGAGGVLAATDCGALDADRLLVETGDLGVALDDI
jgi:hypothetical protein